MSEVAAPVEDLQHMNTGASLKEFKEKMNAWGAAGIPFLFIVDFEMQRPVIFRLDEVRQENVLYNINGRKNCSLDVTQDTASDLTRFPVPFEVYKSKFDKVRAHLDYGDSYLTNLTMRTPVRTHLSLQELFFLSKAKYKLWFEDRFLVFSPETFVRISKGRIFSHPMKGTIDAELPNALEQVLSDRKEFAEHVTIVDLIRNDLSCVAANVQVARFRYVEKITTVHKNLLQVSSEIHADLPATYRSMLGDILIAMLPAGSVSGAPKRKTVEIIREAEGEPRGYYTGVMGVFDGEDLDSGVMIRFIEREDDRLYYRSGGGITVQSDPATEYQELIDKVYVPLD